MYISHELLCLPYNYVYQIYQIHFLMYIRFYDDYIIHITEPTFIDKLSSQLDTNEVIIRPCFDSYKDIS